MVNKWHHRFLGLAWYTSQWSKDPSTKVGAVIVRPDKTICSLGYNGFPRGIEDTPSRYEDRNIKYSLVVHAELNAILNAKEDMKGYSLYIWPFGSCERCAVHVIQSGIKYVYYPKEESLHERFKKSHALANNLYRQAGLIVTEI